MRRLQRGASYVPLIAVVVLLLIAVTWAWIKTDEADQLKKQFDVKSQEFDKADQKRREVLAYIVNRVAPPLGFPVDPGSTDPLPEYAVDYKKISRFAAEKLEALKTTYTRSFPIKAYSIDERGGIKLDTTGDNLKIGYVEPGNIPGETTLELLYVHMAGAMERMLADITRLVEEIDRLKQAADAAQVAFQNTINEKDSTISQKTKEYSDLQASAANREQELTAEVNTLKDNIRASEDALRQEQEARREEVAGLRSNLQSREQEVVKLKFRQSVRENPIGPDGEILAVTSGQDVVVLNRGKDKHMMPGLSFEVYDYGKGSVQRPKGSIVVIEVGDNTSKARVMGLVNPMLPIVQGDLFESATYNPEEQMHFFLLGRFQKYGKSDAAKRLAELGAIVDKEVSVDTDYLVMGLPETEEENLRDSDAYKRAVELGIRILTEAQLSQFLLY